MVENTRKTTRLSLALLALCVLGLLGACSSSNGLAGSGDPDQPREADDSRVDSGAEADVRSSGLAPESAGLDIVIDRVSDGDSVRATSSEGDLEIRLIGINAPEQDECFGFEAGEQLESLLRDAEVVLHPWPADLDDFGRELGFLVADGVLVNLALVESGHVLARAQSDHEFVSDFDRAEELAAAAGDGLWADDACGDPVDGDLVIVEVFENAPGDDRENPNGEFVILENVGDNAVSMQDWGLRDESTRHRYTFPDVVVEPGELVQIRTGCGSNDQGSDPIELFWCDPEPPVWNNGGDLALLLDPNGAIVSEFVVVGS